MSLGQHIDHLPPCHAPGTCGGPQRRHQFTARQGVGVERPADEARTPLADELGLLRRGAKPQAALEQVRAIYKRARVFEKAEKLIEKYRARAEALADEVEPVELRELLYFLVDSVLDRPCPEEPEEKPLQLLQLVAPPTHEHAHQRS